MSNMEDEVLNIIEPYLDRHLWEACDVSDRIVDLFRDEIERLRVALDAERDQNHGQVVKTMHLQALIDDVAYSDAHDALAWDEVLEALLAAATPKEVDRAK